MIYNLIKDFDYMINQNQHLKKLKYWHSVWMSNSVIQIIPSGKNLYTAGIVRQRKRKEMSTMVGFTRQSEGPSMKMEYPSINENIYSYDWKNHRLCVIEDISHFFNIPIYRVYDVFGDNKVHKRIHDIMDPLVYFIIAEYIIYSIDWNIEEMLYIPYNT